MQPDPRGAAVPTDAGLDIVNILADLCRCATLQMRQGASHGAGRPDANNIVARRIEEFEPSLRGLLAVIATPTDQRSIYQRPETARTTRDDLDKLIAALEEWQQATDATALFLRLNKPWPGHIDLPGAVELARGYAVLERERQSARITRGNQPKPAFDFAVLQLGRCWEIVTGSFPTAARRGRTTRFAGERASGDDDGDSSRFAEWARTTLPILAPDLGGDQLAANTAIAQSLGRIAKEGKAMAERAKDPMRGIRQIIA